MPSFRNSARRPRAAANAQDRVLAPDSFAIFVDAFKQGMRDNGMVEDLDYVLDLRYADGDYSRFPTLAAEVARRKPAVIVVTTISAARAAQRAQQYRLSLPALSIPSGKNLSPALHDWEEIQPVSRTLLRM